MKILSEKDVSLAVMIIRSAKAGPLLQDSALAGLRDSHQALREQSARRLELVNRWHKLFKRKIPDLIAQYHLDYTGPCPLTALVEETKAMLAEVEAADADTG